MRKKLLFVRQWRQWNRLVAKFNKVHQRLAMALDANEQNQLLNKLKTVFHQLEKMQSHTGIRLAGTALALVLTTATANAQEFKLKGDVKLYQPADLDVTGAVSMAFADIDKDGDQDLYLGMNHGTINEYLNDGNGAFTYKGKLKDKDGIIIDAGVGCIITFGDCDKDGKLDLFISENNFSNFTNIKNYEQNDDSQFVISNFLQSHEIQQIFNMKLADYDGDGDAELLVGYHHYQSLLTDKTRNLQSSKIVSVDKQQYKHIFNCFSITYPPLFFQKNASCMSGLLFFAFTFLT